MSYSQLMIALITFIVMGITAAVSFVLFDPPYSVNFQIEVASIFLSQILLGLTFAAKFGKDNSSFPFSLGLLPVNVLYFAFTVIMALFADLQTKVFLLWHGVGLAVTTILCVAFQMCKHHVDEQSKEDPSSREIEPAKVTWR